MTTPPLTRAPESTPPVGSILLIHGFTGAPQCFEKLSLPEGSKPFCPSLLGHAPGEPQSHTPSEPLDESGAAFEHEVDRLATWCRQHDFQPGHLLGYSLGARLGLGLLLRHPALFTSATLIGLNPGITHTQARLLRREQDAEWAALLRTQGINAFVDAWQGLKLFETQDALPETVQIRQSRLRRSHSAEGLASSLETCGTGAMPDYSLCLDQVAIPVQLVVGARDTKFRDLMAPLERRLPNAKLHLVPDAGHNPLLEKPHIVSQLLRQSFHAPPASAQNV